MTGISEVETETGREPCSRRCEVCGPRFAFCPRAPAACAGFAVSTESSSSPHPNPLHDRRIATAAMTMKSYTIGGHLRLLRSALAPRSIAGESCATMIALGHQAVRRLFAGRGQYLHENALKCDGNSRVLAPCRLLQRFRDFRSGKFASGISCYDIAPHRRQ